MKSKPPGTQALRKGRISIPDHYYLLTSSTVGRKQILKIPDVVSIVIASLKWMDRKSLFHLDTAVIMPDHFHFIAELKHFPLPSLMKMLKGYTARKINLLTGTTGHIWQVGYHDHLIRKDERLSDIRQYCLHNPVRAGIVTDFHDYPHWFCCKLETT